MRDYGGEGKQICACMMDKDTRHASGSVVFYDARKKEGCTEQDRINRMYNGKTIAPHS